jgi:gliding motility-associated-like protein
VVDLGDDTTLCFNQSIALNALNIGVKYLWQDGSKNATFLVTKAGTYWVQVSVGNCAVSDEIKIDFVPCECSLILPNAFSPNSDLVNDEFKAIDNSKVELKELSIYDRWGNRVFTAEHFSQSWDGKYKGVVADVSTYFYMIKYKCLLTGKEILMKGDVTLIV